MNLYETFTNYYLAFGLFCLSSVYFPISSFLTLLFYVCLHYFCSSIIEFLELTFTDPFKRLEKGKNKMMIYMEIIENINILEIHPCVDEYTLSKAILWIFYYFSYKGYFNFWDPLKEEYMIFDTDYNGRTIFYFIDKSSLLTTEDKKCLKNAIVTHFKNYMGFKFEPYRVARKKIKKLTKRVVTNEK